MSCLDPTLDVVFKLLLTREPRLLRDMLSGVLGRSIGGLTILNPEIPGEVATDRRIAMDIRAQLDDGARADVEMQRQTPAILQSRLIYYTARDYGDQLRQGDGYDLLTPTTGVVWLVEPLVTIPPQFHSIFELRERHTHTCLSEHLAIHVLQLPYLSRYSPPHPSRYTARVERWGRFLAAKDDAERRRLTSGDLIMTIANQTLEQLSADRRARRLAREREDEIKLFEIGRRVELAASRAEGQLEGRATLLLKLLSARFGAPSMEIRTRVSVAGAAQLEAWAERVLTAETMDDVFAP